MRASNHAYRSGDLDMIGYLVTPGDGRPRPGILLAPEGPGLGEHARRRAERLSDLGYVVLAADLHGGGRVAASHEETLAVAEPLVADRSLLRARMRGALDALLSIPGVDGGRVVAIGYCLGGLAVLELARTGAPVAGTVTFHGLLPLDNPADLHRITGKLLLCTGVDDHLVPPADVAAFEAQLSATAVDWQLIRYGGAKHAFTNAIDAAKLEPLGFGYDARADRRSWDTMLTFLDEIFA